MQVTFDFYRHGISCANILRPPHGSDEAKSLVSKIDVNLNDVYRNAALENAGLTTFGAAESRRKGADLLDSEIRYDLVCSSPLSRCVQTAYLMFVEPYGESGPDIHIMPNLRELHTMFPDNQVDHTLRDPEYWWQLNKHGEISDKLDEASLNAYVKSNDRSSGNLIEFMRSFPVSESCTVAVATHSALMKRDFGLSKLPKNNSCVRVVATYDAVGTLVDYKVEGIPDGTAFEGVDLVQASSKAERFASFCRDPACRIRTRPNLQHAAVKQCAKATPMPKPQAFMPGRTMPQPAASPPQPVPGRSHPERVMPLQEGGSSLMSAALLAVTLANAVLLSVVSR